MNEYSRLQPSITVTYSQINPYPCIGGGPHSVVWQQPQITGCGPRDLEEVCIECKQRIRFIRYNISKGTYEAAPED
uniref:Uncharacterized protein n=1 Tax=viral metagenome TaxID=1070528 RepID=A0A6M3Y0B9_9ZZZZ